MNYDYFPLFRKIALCLLLFLLIGLTQWPGTTRVQPVSANDSPLPSPSPTLVVTYQTTPPTSFPTLDLAAPSAYINLLGHSPLPTPTSTAIPDFEPPQTTLRLTGQQSDNDWYRSPVTLTFALTDNIAAGVTEYQLDGDAAWTSREYYYPPVTLVEEGIHTVAYRSLDWAKNREAA